MSSSFYISISVSGGRVNVEWTYTEVKGHMKRLQKLKRNELNEEQMTKLRGRTRETLIRTVD